jgi:predicted DNA-binding transcriptional regulator AlpA
MLKAPSNATCVAKAPRAFPAIQAVLALSRVSRATWYRWVANPAVSAPPGVKLGGQFTRWSVVELRKFERRRGAARTGSVV